MRNVSESERAQLLALCARVRELRTWRNLTQEKLAELATVDATYIWKVENGKVRDISVLVLHRLAEALRVQPRELLLPPNTPPPADRVA